MSSCRQYTYTFNLISNQFSWTKSLFSYSVHASHPVDNSAIGKSCTPLAVTKVKKKTCMIKIIVDACSYRVSDHSVLHYI